MRWTELPARSFGTAANLLRPPRITADYRPATANCILERMMAISMLLVPILNGNRKVLERGSSAMSFFRSSLPATRCCLIFSAALVAIPLGTGWAQNMPDAPGKAETLKVCSGCHEVTRATSMHLDRAGWQNEMEKMISL